MSWKSIDQHVYEPWTGVRIYTPPPPPPEMCQAGGHLSDKSPELLSPLVKQSSSSFLQLIYRSLSLFVTHKSTRHRTPDLAHKGEGGSLAEVFIGTHLPLAF